MKALVKYKKGKGYIKVKEVPKPIINSKEVLIKVKFAGICGTDIHIWHDQYPYWPPVVLGHEFSGEIVEIGNSVAYFGNIRTAFRHIRTPCRIIK